MTRKDDENYISYTKRIVRLVQDKVINYSEMGDLLLEGRNCYSSENLRKAFYVLEKIVDKFEDDCVVTDNDLIKIIDQKKEELKKERYKTQTVNIERSRKDRHLSRFELFYENVASEIVSLELPEFEPIEYINNVNEHILVVADIHAGSNFITETNEYSFAECTRRFNILLNHMIWYVQRNDISKLKVLCLGDDIQNILRISDLKLNESTVVEATVFVAKTISKFLNDLSSYCEIDYYHCPTSNHSQVRPLNTKASEIASEDIEYIIGNYIRDVLVNNLRINVNTNFGYEYIEIPIFDFKTIAMHGHQIKSIENSLKDLSYQKKVFYDTVFLAHFHGGKEIVVGETSTNDTEVLVCPSFVGSCPYAEKIMKGAKPACKVFVFNKKYGHTDTHKIILN